MYHLAKPNSLPINEDDTVVLLNHAEKKIKVGTTLVGEINHIPVSMSYDDGFIRVMWHSNFQKQLVLPAEVHMLENRCDLGMSVRSLKEKDKYGVCIRTKTKVACVVLNGTDSGPNKYLLNVDADRLQSFSDLTNDLCFYKNAIFEITDICYSVKLNYQDKWDLEIRSTRRNFMKRFVVLDDKYNKNFPSEKPMELGYTKRAPFSFNEITGKLIAIKLSELTKFKGCPELKKLIDLIDLSKEDCIENDWKMMDNSCVETDAKESFEGKWNGMLSSETARLERKAKDRMVKFTVCDVAIGELILNCIKDFSCSDQEFKTEKISGDQLDKLMFLKGEERPIELGSRWKLTLSEQDELVDFERFEGHLNCNIKSRITNLSRLSKDLDLTDYKLEVNDFYERQPANKPEPADASPGGVQDSTYFLTDAPESLDEVFSDVMLETVKQLNKDEIRNNNLMMLSRLNRRGRNSSSRNGSLNARQTSERLMSSSFRKIKLGSSDDWQEIDEADLNGLATKHSDQAAGRPQSEKTVLVDVLYLEKFVDVHWQDNTIENDVPLSLVGQEIDGLIHKFYPGDFVEFTGEPRDGLEPTYGVIQRIKQSANLAEVKWFVESTGSSNGSDDVNNNGQSKSWTTNEPLFNLRSSCIHFHLNDIVVDQKLITNFSRISVEEMPKLIGVIKSIQVDGTAWCEWADGSKSQKRLVQLVSFFDVEFSDYSYDNSFSTMNDTQESSAISQSEDSLVFENRGRRSRFTDQIKFNKYKFECGDDLSSVVDKATFKEQWLKKVERIDKLVQEFKRLQFEHLEKQAFYSEANRAHDKRIIELTFELLSCHREKIANINATSPGLDTFYPLLIFSLNNWLDAIQSKFEFLYDLFEANTEIRVMINGFQTAKHLADGAFIDSFNFGLADEKTEKQNSVEYKRKIIVLLNKFNREVVKRVDAEQDDAKCSDELEDSLNFGEGKVEELNSSVRSNLSLNKSGNSLSSASSQSNHFRRLHCLSLEENGIKHEFESSNHLKNAAQKVNLSVLMKELALLRSSLPSTGIYFRTFEERLDLLSLMIEGSNQTVYQSHLFLFDLRITDQLQDPPECFYLSFGKRQLNPNLYLDGNVCLSLLNTFFGKSEVEKWQPGKSSLLQLALSLQALVLNSNPFFNEADFDVYCNTDEGLAKSKSYNEFVIVSLIDYAIDLMRRRSVLAFKNEIEQHYRANALAIHRRYSDFIFVSMSWATKLKQAGKLDEAEQNELLKRMYEDEHPQFNLPPFHLLPASEGFCLSLSKSLKTFVSFFKEYLPAEQVEIMELTNKKIDDVISLIEV